MEPEKEQEEDNDTEQEEILETLADLDDRVEALSEKIDNEISNELDELKEELSTAKDISEERINEVKTSLTKLIDKNTEQFSSLFKTLDGVIKNNEDKTELSELRALIGEKIQTLNEIYAEKNNKILQSIDNLNVSISDVESFTKDTKTSFSKNIEDVKKEIFKKIDELRTDVLKLEGQRAGGGSKPIRLLNNGTDISIS